MRFSSRNLGAALLLVAAGAFAWSNSFEGPFLYDDHENLEQNPHLRSLWPLSRALSAPAQSGLVGRPLASLSYALTHALGGGEVWAHHVGNLAVHVLAALALFGLVRRILQSPPCAERFGRSALPLALAVALLWELHPLQTASVTYLDQRIEALAGLFLLLTLYCAVRAIHGDRSRPWPLFAWLACAAGAATKEVMIAAPLLVSLYDWRFGAGTLRGAFAARARLHGGLFATLGLLALMIALAEGRSASVGFGLEGMTAWSYLKIQALALVRYVRLAFWPSPLIFDYGTNWEPSTAEWLPAGLAVLLALAASAFLLARLSTGARLSGFCGAWFFLILAPTSSLLPIVTEPIVEHRMYLPLAAPIALAVVGGHGLLARAFGSPAARGAIAGVLAGSAAVALGALTLVRNRDYSSELGMWADVVHKLPGNDRAQAFLGNDLRAAGRMGEALARYQEAVRLAPDDPARRANHGSAYLELGRVGEGIAELERAVALEPDFGIALFNLGNARLALGEREAAADCYARALRGDFALPVMAHRQLAKVLEELGRRAKAVEHYKAALALEPSDLDTILGLAWLWVRAPERELRNGQEALRAAEWLARTAQGDPQVLDLLAAAQAENGPFELAVETARRAEQAARREGATQAAQHFAERAELYGARRTLAGK